MKYLTKDNFTEIENTKGVVFVKFSVAQGCKFCAEFAPVYERYATQHENCYTYERESLSLPLDEIQNKYNIRSFPTVIAFENGIYKGTVPKYVFNTDRELAGIILDEQKKLYNQQCYLEDLMLEVQNRKKDPLDAPLPTPLNKPQEECINCQS